MRRTSTASGSLVPTLSSQGNDRPSVLHPRRGAGLHPPPVGPGRNGEGVSQAIVEIETDRAIGLMWVALRPQPHVGGLGHWIVPPERGQGAAAAAVNLVVPWALNVHGLRRLEAWVQPENLASQRVLHRAGFQQVGRLRNFLTIDDRSVDALVFSVIAPAR